MEFAETVAEVNKLEGKVAIKGYMFGRFFCSLAWLRENC